MRCLLSQTPSQSEAWLRRIRSIALPERTIIFRLGIISEMGAVEAHKSLKIFQESAGFNGDAPTPVRLVIVKDGHRVKEVYPSIYRDLIGIGE